MSIIRSNKLFCLLLIIYLLVRFYNLTNIPLFNDEAIYLDWGWRELHKGVLYYSLIDGKQPLLMWLFGYAEGVIDDPLFAGRSVSVFIGFFSVLGLFFLGREVFTKRVGLLAMIFYICSSYFAFFDRQALMESAICAVEVWIIFLYIKLVKNHSYYSSILLGIVLGLGVFIKATLLLFILSLLFIIPASFKIQTNKKFLLDFCLALFVSQLVLLPLYLQPLFWQTLATNNRYSMSLGEISHLPLFIWSSNLSALFQIGLWQLTPILFLIMLIAIVLIIKKGTAEQKIVAWSFLSFACLLVLVAKNMQPRYALPLFPLSFIFVASLVEKWRKWRALILSALLIIPVYFLILQIFEPGKYFEQLHTLTNYSQMESYQRDDTAGYATMQAVTYISNLPIPVAVVAVRLDTGNPENAVFTFLHTSQTRVPTFLEARIIRNVANYQCLSYRVPVYFVSRDKQLAGLDRFLQEEKRFYNIGGNTSVGVYHLKYPCVGPTSNLAIPGAILQPTEH